MRRVKKELGELKRFKILRAVAPHAVYTVGVEGLKIVVEIAEKENTLIYFHLAETEKEILEFKKGYGRGIVEVLNEIGFLNSKLLCAHSVWL